jgi:hypothetical protein
MTAPGSLRFFAVVIRPSGAIVASATAIVSGAIYWAVLDPRQYVQAGVLALFLQMFSAATGYRDRIRRGHFDGILTKEPRRLRIAAAHCAVSIVPGVVLWVLVAIVEAALIRAGWPATVTASGLAALLAVSVLSWAIAVAFGRHSAGPLWIAAIFVLASTGHLQQLRYQFLTADTSWMAAGRQAGSALACPVLLVTDPGAITVRAHALLLLAVSAVWLAAAALVARYDAPLEERV